MAMHVRARWGRWLATLPLLVLGCVLLAASGRADADSATSPIVEIERWLPLEGGGMKRVTVIVDTRVANAEQVLAEGYPHVVDTGGVTAQFATFAKFAPQDVPVSVAYDNTGDPPGIDGEANVTLAMDTWNEVPGQSFSFALNGAPGVETPTCAGNFGDGVNTILFSNGLAPGILGETCTLFFLTVDGMSRIVEFDLHLSGSTPWSDGPVTDDDTFDLPTVILHELGHALGLDHSAHGSVMQPVLQPGTQLRKLTGDDIAGVLTLYGTGSTPSPTPTPTATVPATHPFRSMLGSLARD
ncbi:MAG: matrixin family metalloprotease [Dehalococcoidia bacterium]